MAKKKVVKINVGQFPYVDIMPQSRIDSIERGIAKSKWTRFVVAGTVFALVLSAGSVGFKFLEQINYDQAVSEKDAVEALIKTNGEVDAALTIRDSLTSNLLSSSASTINWQDLIQRVSQNLPSNSSLVSFQVQTGGIEEGKPAIALLVNIASTEPIAYSTVLESFGQINGLVDGSLAIGNLFAQGSIEAGDLRYIYPVAFSIDTSILSNLFSYLTNGSEAPAAPEKLNEEQLEPEAPAAEGTPEETPTEEATNGVEN